MHKGCFLSSNSFLALTYTVTELGCKISIPIYSELYITIVNVSCNIYSKNSDFLMTAVSKFKIIRRYHRARKYWATQSELDNHGKAQESQEQSVTTVGRVT